MALLYDNNVKISLRNEVINIFYVVPWINYDVKESPLHKHRDEYVDVKF